jgi:hypothetical protein
MIRDPSDGTVKEINPQANKINTVAAKQAPKEIGLDTGIRQPTKTDAQARMEKSRVWLKEYHARKGYPQKSEDETPSRLCRINANMSRNIQRREH